MWISKKEWNEKCDSNRKLLRDKTEKDQVITSLHEDLNSADKEITRLIDEINHQESVNNIQKESLDIYRKDNQTLLAANEKLIEWINKIINEVGIYEVQDKKHVTIPIYKNPVKAMYGTSEEISNNLREFVQTEEIVIPEIRFVRMK